MAIGTITIADRLQLGDGGQLLRCTFAGDVAYPTGGTLAAAVLTALKAALKTAEGLATDTNVRGPENPTIAAIIAGDCGKYVPTWVTAGLKVLDGGSATRAQVGNGVNLSGTTFTVTFLCY
jgi:hypothetical protein